LVPEALFRTIPGIGHGLARRLVDDGQLETLEELEHWVNFGGVEVKGVGPSPQAHDRRGTGSAPWQISPFRPSRHRTVVAASGTASQGGRDVSSAQRRRHAAQDRAQAFQSGRRRLVADHACPA